jgi:hypothetical protein
MNSTVMTALVVLGILAAIISLLVAINNRDRKRDAEKNV